jgi:hypothetical protein
MMVNYRQSCVYTWFIFILFTCANPFEGARLLTDGHFDQITGAFFFYCFAVGAPAVCAAKVSGYNCAAACNPSAQGHYVSKRLSWLRYGLARKTNCPSARTVGVGGVTRHQGRAPYLYRHDGYNETMHTKLRKCANSWNRRSKCRTCPTQHRVSYCRSTDKYQNKPYYNSSMHPVSYCRSTDKYRNKPYYNSSMHSVSYCRSTDKYKNKPYYNSSIKWSNIL